MKYVVEVSENGIKKTFVDYKGKTYEEQWIRDEDGTCHTIGKGITTKLEEDINDVIHDTYLMDALGLEDFFDIWDCMEDFEEYMGD